MGGEEGLGDISNQCASGASSKLSGCGGREASGKQGRRDQLAGELEHLLYEPVYKNYLNYFI